MIQSKYLAFDQIGFTGKTFIYNVVSKAIGYKLGQIRWYPKWRQYCFYPATNCIFNNGCLSDIQRMIAQLMAERKEKKK